MISHTKHIDLSSSNRKSIRVTNIIYATRLSDIHHDSPPGDVVSQPRCSRDFLAPFVLKTMTMVVAAKQRSYKATGSSYIDNCHQEEAPGFVPLVSFFLCLWPLAVPLATSNLSIDKTRSRPDYEQHTHLLHHGQFHHPRRRLQLFRCQLLVRFGSQQSEALEKHDDRRKSLLDRIEPPGHEHSLVSCISPLLLRVAD